MRSGSHAADNWRSFDVPDDFPPACKCGCGEPVPYRSRGFMVHLAYANTAHAKWGANSHGREGREWMDGPTFTQALMKIKQDKGWTWRQMGDQSGQHWGTLHSYVHRPPAQVSRATAERILRRLAGQGTRNNGQLAKRYKAQKSRDKLFTQHDNKRVKTFSDRKAKVEEALRRLAEGSE